MALTITVDSVDITAYVDVTSIVIEQVASAAELAATCRFTARDATGTIAIDPEDDMSIVASGPTTLFEGKVKEVLDDTEGITQVWHAYCVDYNILLEETVITSYTIDTNDDDDAEIDSIFTTYRSDIDSTTYVTQLDTTMPELVLDAMTIREAMDEICGHTGGRFYVDFSKNLHYFSAEANSAAFSLSDNPDDVSSFGYRNFQRRRSSTMLSNRFWIEGDGVNGWVTGGSYGAGDPEGVNRDNRITTTSGRDKRGNQLLDRYEGNRLSYELETKKDGLQAGMDVTVVNALWSVNSSLTIRKIRMTLADTTGDTRWYHLWLNDELPDEARRGQKIARQLGTIQRSVDEIDDSVFDDDAPAAPTFVDGNLTTGVDEDVTGAQYAWIEATWGLVGDADLHHYEIQCSDNTSFNFPMIVQVLAGGDREARFEPLVGNTDHYLRVRAVDWTGNYSAWSPTGPPAYLTKTTAADTTAPGQVTGLSAGSSRTLVGLSWTANTEADLRHYEVQRADDDSGSPDTYATITLANLNFYIDQDFTDAEIAAQDTFWYRVRAVDTSGNDGTWATQVSVALGQIDGDHIAADVITANHIAANTITANEIAANTITANEIAASTITAAELNVSTLSAITADMGTLTAGEIRVGTGSVGVDFTGFRIMSSYIAGYNSDTLQAGIRVSDGKMVAGAGDVVLDTDGVTIEQGTNAANKINWEDSGTVVGSMWTYQTTAAYLNLSAVGLSAGTPQAAVFIKAEHENDASQDANLQLYSGSKPYVLANDILFVNESADANMTIGLGINQGANDDEAFAVKSSDVAHGITDYAETDTYFAITKQDAAAGGAALIGYRDADAGGYAAIMMLGRLGESADSTKTTGSYGVVHIAAQVISGTGVTSVGADGNLVSITNNTTTRFLFDAEGSGHADVEWTTFDEEDDVALLGALELEFCRRQDRLKDGFGAWLDGHRAALQKARIVNFYDDGPRGMVNFTRLAMLQVGAIRQMAERLERYERALVGLGMNPTTLDT